MRFTSPRKLSELDQIEDFNSGHVDLDDWLKKFALTNQRSSMSTVFVSICDERVVGYYALATGGVATEDAPARVTQGVARHPVPVVILARLAVDIGYQGKGLGKALLLDALERIAQAADEIGIRALLIHAKDENARDFYLHQAEFEPSPTDPLHLLLLMKDLRACLGR